VLSTGTVSKDKADSIVDVMEWKMKGFGVQKNNLAMLDIIAHNHWKRPIYFSITTGNEAYAGLEKYFQLEGLAYRLVPIRNNNKEGQIGLINTGIMYDHLMNKFKWGNMQDSTVYLDETNLRMTMNFRNNFARLAEQLIDEGKKDSAIKVLDRCMKVMPEASVPFDYFIMPAAEAYYKAGAIDKANKIMSRLTALYDQNLAYLFAFTGEQAKVIVSDKEQSLAILNRVIMVATAFKQDAVAKKAKEVFDKFYSRYSGSQTEEQNQNLIRR
jgi:tetratricopeptide (TPR) repeat protein